MVLPPGYAETRALLEKELDILPDKPDETPEVTLRVLWSMAAGFPRSVAQAMESEIQPLNADQLETLEGLVTSRLSGVPLAHLTGRQDFLGTVLKATPAALIPRKETELLALHAREKIPLGRDRSALLLDVCTGAGNVALAMALHAPSARVLGSDVEADAVALARENAEFVGRPDVEFRLGDLLAPFDEPGFLGAVDVLTCNPPYISTVRVAQMPQEISTHEPAMAFDGGPFGVSVLRRLVADAPRWIRAGGWLVTEVGEGQGPAVERLLQRSPAFENLEPIADDGGHVRVVAAQRTNLGAP